MPLSPTAETELRRDVRREADALALEFTGIFSKTIVDRLVEDSLATFTERQVVTTFVPSLVRRYARERLKALAQAEGLVGKGEPELLFVCTHNAGRSQMAAVLATSRSEGRVHARSAGVEPPREVNSVAVSAMGEIGLDLSTEFPKPVTEEVLRAADCVVTMGCEGACPIVPGVRYVEWQIDDPAGQPIDVVRRIRDEIDRNVRWLLADIGVGIYR